MQHESSLGQTKAPESCAYGHALQVDGSLNEREPWERLLADAAPRDHIVQLYQDQQFLNRAVCRFAAAALANGEGGSSGQHRLSSLPDWGRRRWHTVCYQEEKGFPGFRA